MWSFNQNFLKKLYGPFLWMGFNYFKATEPLQGGSLLFTTKFQEIPSTHLISLGRNISKYNYKCICWVWPQILFLRTWIFTEMNFSEPFQTVASELLSYLVVRIINQMIISLFHFLFPSSNFYGFEEYLFWSLQKIKIKKEWWDIYFATPQVSGSEMFLGKFSEITRINS